MQAFYKFPPFIFPIYFKNKKKFNTYLPIPFLYNFFSTHTCPYRILRFVFCKMRQKKTGAEDDILRFAQSFLAKTIFTVFRSAPCFARRANSRYSRFFHAFYAKKQTSSGRLFFGAEDEIRTRATVSHTTPLAGEPLEPLGYFCIH